jgi:hypothetical protein
MPGPAEDIARLRGQVQKGDADAIVKAGDTYNPVFIGDLRALQKSLKKKELYPLVDPDLASKTRG